MARKQTIILCNTPIAECCASPPYTKHVYHFGLGCSLPPLLHYFVTAGGDASTSYCGYFVLQFVIPLVESATTTTPQDVLKRPMRRRRAVSSLLEARRRHNCSAVANTVTILFHESVAQCSLNSPSKELSEGRTYNV